MLALRVMLGAASLMGLAAFALILLVGKGFDAFRSGAGGEDLAGSAATVLVPVMLLGMLASVCAPGTKWLLHGTAVLTAAAVIVVLTMIAEHPGEGALYLSLLAAWLLFYWLAAWARA